MNSRNKIEKDPDEVDNRVMEFHASPGEGKTWKNYQVKCMCCNQKPTVGDSELCGPCFFGEADTLGGNW